IPKKDGQGRTAAIEVLKSTMRTRDYVEKGESEGKTLLDAMRDGTTEGMQHFDGELDRLVREGVIDFETAMSFATNAGNLRLEMQDYLESANSRTRGSATTAKPKEPEVRATEMEIERF